MTRLRSILLAFTAAVVTACSGDTILPPTDAEYVGTLAEFLPGMASLGAPVPVLLKGKGGTSPADEAIVHIGAETDVWIVGRGGRLHPAEREDLAVNDVLQVWTTGAEMRSYPVQVFAERIHIVR
ncbi:MAG TPA: hypothetical protein VGC13_02890 [Longimicrobium sp.]|jgi:hypothetical protein|uniref:hypothetical protein n=1 Tax=Longimicrobium sp. TaxID=2029185 RepID=UPI002ED7ED5D